MIGRSHQDIYIAACGQPFPNRREGVSHEKTCGRCREEISGLSSGPSPYGGYDVTTAPQHAFASAAESAAPCHCGHCREARETSHLAEGEARQALTDTRRISRLDSREVAALIQPIDH